MSKRSAALFYPETRPTRLLPRDPREEAIRRIASLRDVEIHIYPDGSVCVHSMTTWQSDDDAAEAIRSLISP